MRLALTSPHTKGPHVKALQTQLKRHGFLHGQVDGEFGPDTARAVYRAKYWLGYRKPDQVAGDLLYSLLKGTKKPTPPMKIRIARRKRTAKKEPVSAKMWKESAKWIGHGEHPPGSNQTIFGRWYGIQGAPWCGEFITYCGVAVRSKAFRRGSRYAYVPYILADARAGIHNLAITYRPITGDLVLYDWNNDNVPDHVELFGNWVDTSRQRFNARGGNTSNNMVQNTNRSRSDVRAYVHVGA